MPETTWGVLVDHYGLLSLLPTAFVITTAVLTHRPVAALLVGVTIGILLLEPTAAVSTFSDIMLEVMQDETIGWVIMSRRAAPRPLRARWPRTRIRATSPCSSPGFWAWFSSSTIT
jgi:hypothetical protein